MGLSASSLPCTASRVLLVDDDDCVREVTGMILERMGHCVRATGNGVEALRWLEAEACDLLIVDVKMPEIDGPTLYREVLARWPMGGPRVVFISGFAETPSYDNVPEARDVPLLFKPFTIDELKAVLNRGLATV